MTSLRLLGASLAITTFMTGAAFAQTTLSMWYHGAGNEVESNIVNQIISDFNASQSDWKVEIQSFPQAAYNDSVVAGALAGGAMQVNSLVSQVLAGSDEGARSVIYNADRLYQLPLVLGPGGGEEPQRVVHGQTRAVDGLGAGPERSVLSPGPAQPGLLQPSGPRPERTSCALRMRSATAASVRPS